MNDIVTYINDKRDEIKRLKAEIFEAQCKRWEELYKDRCEEYFLPLKEFIGAIAFDNNFEGCDENVYSFKKCCSEEETEVNINSILAEMKSHNLIFIPDKIAKMICEACSCQNCKYIKEHLGYTCQDCINSKYRHYSGYCDE